MNKAIVVVFAALLLVGCAGEGGAGVARVTFSVVGVESGAMTKVSSDDVADLISAAASGYGISTLTLVSKANAARTYEVTPGVEAVVGVGAYTVTGSVAGGAPVASLVGNAKVRKAPGARVDAEVTVTKDGGSFSLVAEHTCFALVLDRTKVASYSLTMMQGGLDELSDNCYFGDGDLAVTFITPSASLASTPITLRVTPADDVNFEEKTFSLGTNPTIALGRWYSFSPAALQVAEGGFSVSYPSWGEGFEY